MNRTSIEWTDFTWNPITGCLGPGGTPEHPQRCPYCYAHRLANGRLKRLYLSNPNVAPSCDPDDPFSPRFWPDRLGKPLKRKKAAKIFVVDMGDLFHPAVPSEWRVKILSAVLSAHQHTYMYLTKSLYRIGRMDWERNEWLGITCTNQRDWDERWPILVEVDAKVRFVSFEPLLGPVEMYDTEGLDWIILGAQTGPKVRIPEWEWVNSLLRDARNLGIPVFVKENLAEERVGYYIPRPQEFPE